MTVRCGIRTLGTLLPEWSVARRAQHGYECGFYASLILLRQLAMRRKDVVARVRVRALTGGFQDVARQCADLFIRQLPRPVTDRRGARREMAPHQVRHLAQGERLRQKRDRAACAPIDIAFVSCTLK